MPVEPDASRGACPVRGGLAEVMLADLREEVAVSSSPISAFYFIDHNRRLKVEAGRQGQTDISFDSAKKTEIPAVVGRSG